MGRRERSFLGAVLLDKRAMGSISISDVSSMIT